MKLASRTGEEPFKCRYNWPEDCYVQCGEFGVVISDNGNYETAFFEAFPKQPKTFIRGEGKSIEEAETQAWREFQKL